MWSSRYFPVQERGCMAKATVSLPSAMHVQAATSDGQSMLVCVYLSVWLLRSEPCIMHVNAALH